MIKYGPERLSDDWLQVRIPLPFPLRWVNGYLLRGAGGWTLIDPGLHTGEAAALWERVLAEQGIAYRQIERIVLTHYHPDHCGLAGWFQRKSGAQVLLSELGARQVEQFWGENRTMTERLLASFAANGMERDEIAPMREHMESFMPLVSPLPDIETIADGERIAMGGVSFSALETGGHAAGHISFWDEAEGRLLCGDHLLPHITPNISYVPGIEENPLQVFLAGLEKIGRLPIAMAYPGHREPFPDGRLRARQIADHHAERLQRFLREMPQFQTAYALCKAVFGSGLSVHQFRFALGETIAHLLYLADQRLAEREEKQGVVYYRAAGG